MSPRPSPRRELLIRKFDPGEYLEGFRAVRVDDVTDPALFEDFLSHYEADMAPRYEEVEHAALHMALSMWRDRTIVDELIRRYPDKLGPYVARVRMSFGYGFNYLDPGSEANPKHLTVWGDPGTLASCVVEITPGR